MPSSLASGIDTSGTLRRAPDYRFGAFALHVGRRELHRGSEIVQLPSRAFDTLLYLIRNRDRCVGKDEIIGAIWDDVVVTDDSLIHAISVLRRALGDARHQPEFIQTLPRRGYRFVAGVEAAADLRPAPDPAVADAHRDDPGAAIDAPAPQSAGGARVRWRTQVAMTTAAAAVAAVVFSALLAELGSDAGTEYGASIQLFQPSPPDTSIVSGGVLSPDGRHIAFIARQDAGGDTALWVRTLNSNDLRRIDGTDGASKPFWSPGSDQIAYFANGMLQTVGVIGDRRRMITAVFAAAGGSWGSDDTIIYAEWASGLYAVPVSGDGDIERVVALDRESSDIAFAWPYFFPDGHRYLYQVVSLDAARTGVYVGDLATGESRRILDSSSPATLAPPNYLLHVRDGLLIAEELDLERTELTGRASVIARGISVPTLAAENIVSAASNLLAYQQGVTEQNLVWFSRSGETLGAQPVPTEIYNLRLSPDGKRLLGSGSVTSDPGLWLARLDREEYLRLEREAIGPVWSPDGQQVAFAVRTGFDLILRSVDGEGPGRLLASDDAVMILNDWTPDGRELVYSRHEPPSGLDLWVIDVATGARQPLLATSHSETQARLSPDGQWIAFASDESGTLETYVARYPSMQDKRQVSDGGGGQPQWTADQSEIFYLSLDKSIKAVEVFDAGSMAVGQPQTLFRAAMAGDPGDARDYFAADATGTRFLIDTAVNDNRDHSITIMVNWLAGMPDPDTGSQQVARAAD